MGIACSSVVNIWNIIFWFVADDFVNNAILKGVAAGVNIYGESVFVIVHGTVGCVMMCAVERTQESRIYKQCLLYIQGIWTDGKSLRDVKKLMRECIPL